MDSMSEIPLRPYVTSDDVMMVSVEDVLEWLRAVANAWDGTYATNTGDAVNALADDLRDTWLDGTRGRLRDTGEPA